MNLANKLTVFRVFCIPVFVAAMMITAIPYNYYIALAIFIIASLRICWMARLPENGI